MDERQAPFWIYGTGALRLAVSAGAETPATLWVDGEIVDRSVVDGRAASPPSWRASAGTRSCSRCPSSSPTAPPEGLRLDGLVRRAPMSAGSGPEYQRTTASSSSDGFRHVCGSRGE